jgi:hypothetical protein
MVNNTQHYWVFGLFPSSGILGNRKHDVSETHPVSETSRFLFPRILDDGKSPKSSNSEKLYVLNETSSAAISVSSLP